MLNLATEGIGVIMCGILSVTPVTPIPVNPHSINALEIKKETVIHQNEIREVNDIMNHCITGWKYFSNPRIFEGYGRQKGWEREAPATGADNGREKTPDGFVEVTEQMELPF